MSSFIGNNTNISNNNNKNDKRKSYAQTAVVAVNFPAERLSKKMLFDLSIKGKVKWFSLGTTVDPFFQFQKL